MFLIKDKEVKALENNLKEARKEIDDLQKKNLELALENEFYKAKCVLEEKDNIRLQRKIKKMEQKNNVYV